MTRKVPFLTLLPGGLLHALPGASTPPPTRHSCTHLSLEIHIEEQWVECVICGEELDPYELLAGYADEETHLEDLRRDISADLAKGVLACARCGAVPQGEV